MEGMSYVFLLTFFSLPLIFTLVAVRISYFVTAATKFSCRSSNNKWLLISRSSSTVYVALFLRWASLVCLLLSLFLCLSPALYSKFVDMTIDLSLILLTTRKQKQFPLSVFVFIDSLVVSASQDACGSAISRQNNLELHLGCHTCWLNYFTLACLWCGRAVGWSVALRSLDYQIFSER